MQHRHQTEPIAQQRKQQLGKGNTAKIDGANITAGQA